MWNLAGEGERPQAWSPPTVPNSGREGHTQLGTGEKCTEMPSEAQKQFKDPRTGGIAKGSETPTFTPARPGLVWPGVSGWLLSSVTPCSGVCPELCLPRGEPGWLCTPESHPQGHCLPAIFFLRADTRS